MRIIPDTTTPATLARRALDWATSRRGRGVIARCLLVPLAVAVAPYADVIWRIMVEGGSPTDQTIIIAAVLVALAVRSVRRRLRVPDKPAAEAAPKANDGNGAPRPKPAARNRRRRR